MSQICHWRPWQFCRELVRSLTGLSCVVICLMFFSWPDWSDGFFFFFEDQVGQGSLPGIMMEGICYWCDDGCSPWFWPPSWSKVSPTCFSSIKFLLSSFPVLHLRRGSHGCFSSWRRLSAQNVWNSAPERVADFGAGWNAAEKCQGLVLHSLSTKLDSYLFHTYFFLLH